MLYSAFEILRNSLLNQREQTRIVVALCAWASMSNRHREEPDQAIKFDDFYDQSFELTSARWKEIATQLRDARKTHGDEWIFEAVEQSVDHLSPGTLESIRQNIISSLNEYLTPDTIWEELSELLTDRLEQVDFFQPRNEIVELIDNIVSPNPDDKIYCAYDTSASSALKLSRHSEVFLDVQNRDLAQLLSLFAVASGRNLKVRVQNPLDEQSSEPLNNLTARGDWPITFDHVISFPPFNFKMSEKDANNLKLGLQSVESVQAERVLSRGNKIRLAVLSEGPLFRTSSIDTENRIRMINDPDFHSVISLPRGSFGSGSGVSTSMIVFKRLETDKLGVTFIDGRSIPSGFGSGRNPNSKLIRQEWIAQIADALQNPDNHKICWVSDNQELEENDFSLIPSRYVVPREVRALREQEKLGLTFRLEEIADIFKVPAVPSTLDDEAKGEVFEVSLADLHDGAVTRPTASIEVTESTLRKIKKNLLQEGDILLSIKGTIGKVGLVPQLQDEQWVPSQSFVVVRLRRIGENLDPLTLVTYLRSWLGQQLFSGLAGGTTVPMLPMGDLRKLPVPRISKAVQEQVRNHLDQIANLKIQRDELNQHIEKIEKEVLSDFFTVT